MSHDAIEKEKINIIREFNRNPKDGVTIFQGICQENNLDANKEFARFLLDEGFFSKRLNLDHVGNYLSDASLQNEEVRIYFIDQFYLKDLRFEDG